MTLPLFNWNVAPGRLTKESASVSVPPLIVTGRDERISVTVRTPPLKLKMLFTPLVSSSRSTVTVPLLNVSAP